MYQNNRQVRIHEYKWIKGNDLIIDFNISIWIFLRSSNHSILEIPFITNNRRLSLTYANQLSSPPFSIPTTTINSSQPKRHPLRRESLISTTDNNNNTGRRDSASWPLQPTTMVFHKQTNEIKKSSVFFNI